MKKLRCSKALKILLVCQLAMTTPLCTYAANIGVCTHMQASHNGNSVDGILNLVSDIGSDWVRDELRWGWGMETVKGEVHMPRINWTDDASEEGVNNLVILGYGNTIYNPENVEDELGIYIPTVDYKEYFDAFINYVRLVATECKGKVKAYEIWNEPNQKDFNYQIAQNRYSYTASDYFELLKAAHDTIKEIDPDAKIVGGSFLIGGTVTSGWMEELFKSGAGDYMDAFSFHVYTYKDGDAEMAMRAAYDRVEKVLDDNRFTGEVWLTETGYYSGTADCSVSEQEQASLVIRSKLAWDDYLKDNGRVGEFFWYDLREDGTDENAAGHNFGLATYGYVPKNGFYAAKTYNHLLEGKEFVSLTTSDDGNDYLALYDSSVGEITDKVYVAYKKGNYSSAIEVPVSGDVTYVYDYMGNRISTNDTVSGKLSLALTDTSPVFVHCKDYTTEIESLNYDENKNICTVSGRADEFETLTIELVNNSEVVQAETAYVNEDGSFSKFFSVDSDGDYIIRIGKPETEEKGGTHYAEQSIKLKRKSNETSELAISCSSEVETDGLRVSLTGVVGNGVSDQLLNLLLVPSEKESNLSGAVYIGDVKTSEGGTFETSFKIPQTTPHTYHYTLYVRGAKTELKQNSVDYIIGRGDILAYDFALNIDETLFTASAYVKNTTDKTKTPVLFVAQYDKSGVLIEIAKQEVTLGQSEEKKLLSVSVKKNIGAKSCRAYIWGGAGSIEPIATSITKSTD